MLGTLVCLGGLLPRSGRLRATTWNMHCTNTQRLASAAVRFGSHLRTPSGRPFVGQKGKQATTHYEDVRFGNFMTGAPSSSPTMLKYHSCRRGFAWKAPVSGMAHIFGKSSWNAGKELLGFTPFLHVFLHLFIRTYYIEKN